ncbi:MAG: hypothetical protein IJZ58_01725 [Oscillospiraceae bacterium]|nr:hypothetical protein [Oscillospiraceae bacterium]
MGLFLDAAKAWEILKDISYEFDVTRKGKLVRIELFFFEEDFPHIAGMQYAKDVDFGVRSAEYYGEKLIPALINKKIDDMEIEKSKNWNKISGRLSAIINLQNILDGEFEIVSFDNRKVDVYSKIDAKFAIKSTASSDIFFVFLDERTGKYYCRSAFKKEKTDYMKNQATQTILRKIKKINSNQIILYIKDGYQPENK